MPGARKAVGKTKVKAHKRKGKLVKAHKRKLPKHITVRLTTDAKGNKIHHVRNPGRGSMMIYGAKSKQAAYAKARRSEHGGMFAK